MRRAIIAGSGIYHPSNCVPNAVFDDRFGPGVGDWLVTNLDIHQRYWMEEHESTSTMATTAARRALDEAADVVPQTVGEPTLR